MWLDCDKMRPRHLLAADVPLHGHDAPARYRPHTPRQLLADESQVPIRVEVRDKQYKPVMNAKGAGAFQQPDGIERHPRAHAGAARRGHLRRRMDGGEAGSYVAEIIAGRETEEIGATCSASAGKTAWRKISIRRRTGSCSRSCRSRPAAGTTRRLRCVQVIERISYSEAGITTRETRDLWDMPLIFLLALAFRASEWLLRRKWGVV
jgi:hypothetical protein